MDKYLKETWVIIPTPSGNNITTESGLPIATIYGNVDTDPTKDPEYKKIARLISATPKMYTLLNYIKLMSDIPSIAKEVFGAPVFDFVDKTLTPEIRKLWMRLRNGARNTGIVWRTFPIWKV